MGSNTGPAEAEGKSFALPWLDALGLGGLRPAFTEALRPLLPVTEQLFWLLEPALSMLDLRDAARRWLTPDPASPEEESR